MCLFDSKKGERTDKIMKKPSCVKDIYLIRSPFQYLSAVAAKKLSSGSALLVVDLGEGAASSSAKQLEEVVDCEDWESVYYLNTCTSIGRLASYLRLYRQLKNTNVRRAFVGEYRDVHFQLLLSRIMPAKRYLIDDGATTVFIQQEVLSKSALYKPFIEMKFRQRLACMVIHAVWPSPSRFEEKFNLITEFDLKAWRRRGQSITKIVHAKEVGVRRLDELWYFGSKYSDELLLSLDRELAVISFLAGRVYEENLKFIYVPHRGEGHTKLERIRSMGVEVRSLGLPVEHYVEMNKILPRAIAAAWSTVLTTLPNKYEFDFVQCINIPVEWFAHSVQDRAACIYRYYQSTSKVHVLDVPSELGVVSSAES